MDQFSDEVSKFLAAILPVKNNTTMVGADINTSIGTRPTNLQISLPGKHNNKQDIDPIIDLLGPFGINHKSKPEASERILNIMREHNLQADSTFFDNNQKYNIWLAPPRPESKKGTPIKSITSSSQKNSYVIQQM